ncbi:MAG: hypothetical protein ACT4P7_01615 [Gemmatimonadaceae bacterium]
MKVCAPMIGASVLLALCTSDARSQGGTIDPQCRAGTVNERVTQDACQKALDLFTFLAPQLGTALAGGNAVSGEHSTLNGPGRFSIGLRANAAGARLPQIDERTPAVTGAVASDYRIEDQIVPVPTIDAAVGIFRGIPIGGTQAFGLDALLNLAYIPELSEGDIDVTLPSGSLKLGFGGRVSIMRESIITPGISVTYLRRDLPAVTVTGSPGSDELAVENFQVKTSAWRGVIGKNFGPIVLLGGIGQDTYETSALVEVRVTRGGITSTAGPIAAVQRVRRDNVFGSMALNIAMLSIVGEVGRASGGTLTTLNTFSGDRADDELDYASFGLRFRW